MKVGTGMNHLQKIKTTFASYPFVAVFFTWGLILAVAYVLLSLHLAYQNDQAKKGGTEMIQELSKKVGLPLLEKNTDLLQSAVAEVGQKPGVLLTWVVDHQNKVVAFAGNSQILPHARASDGRAGDVDIWQVESAIPPTYYNLVSAVTYSGIRIGRIFLTIAPAAGSDPQAHFMRLVVLSGLFMLILVAAIYHGQLATFASKVSGTLRPRDPETLDLSGSEITCPLCGKPQSLSQGVFEHGDTDALVLLTPPGVDSSGMRTGAAKIFLHEMGGRKDLAWIKQRIILRCTEIIRLLSK
jgi:hypothetical protein